MSQRNGQYSASHLNPEQNDYKHLIAQQFGQFNNKTSNEMRRTRPQFNQIVDDEKTQHSDEENSMSRRVNKKTTINTDKRKSSKLSQQKEFEFGWKNIDQSESIPPSEFTVTNLNQHYDLLVDEALCVLNITLMD